MALVDGAERTDLGRTRFQAARISVFIAGLVICLTALVASPDWAAAQTGPATFQADITEADTARDDTADQNTAAPAPLSLSAPDLVLSGVPITVTASGETITGTWTLSREGNPGVDPVTASPEDGQLRFKVTVTASETFVLTGPQGQEQGRITLSPVPGWLSVLPALLAIICVVVLRQVLPALLLGIWLGSALVYGLAAEGLINGFFDILTVYVIEALTDADHVAILVFTVMIGGLIGILMRNGTMDTIAGRLAAMASTPRRAQTATGVMGLAIFFDDYANTLVVGNTMRPVTDRLRVSREKLAYIVDSTAAPVASLAIVTTWIGFMVSVIQEGVEDVEGFNRDGYDIFLESLAYSFYPITAIALVAIVALSGRDFGPMLSAERRTRAHGVKVPEALQETDISPESRQEPDTDQDTARDRAAGGMAGKTAPGWAALVPLAILIFGTLTGVIVTGSADAGPGASLREIFGAGNSFHAMMWASLGAVITAVMLNFALKLQDLEDTMDGWLAGARSMMLPVVVLTLAWSLASVNDAIQTNDYLVGLLGDTLPAALLPTAVFLASAGMAFTTGTSWGVMGILTPLVLPLALAVTGGDPGGGPIFAATIAAVLGGAVWGDHCSPISDTTVMSSLAAGCSHAEHVRTQLPYAGLAGVATILLGLIPVGLGAPWWLSLAASVAGTYIMFRVLSRPVDLPQTGGAARPVDTAP